MHYPEKDELCPCGSGKPFEKCCYGKKAIEEAQKKGKQRIHLSEDPDEEPLIDEWDEEYDPHGHGELDYDTEELLYEYGGEDEEDEDEEKFIDERSHAELQEINEDDEMID